VSSYVPPASNAAAATREASDGSPLRAGSYRSATATKFTRSVHQAKMQFRLAKPPFPGGLKGRGMRVASATTDTGCRTASEASRPRAFTPIKLIDGTPLKHRISSVSTRPYYCATKRVAAELTATSPNGGQSFHTLTRGSRAGSSERETRSRPARPRHSPRRRGRTRRRARVAVRLRRPRTRPPPRSPR